MFCSFRLGFLSFFFVCVLNVCLFLDNFLLVPIFFFLSFVIVLRITKVLNNKYTYHDYTFIRHLNVITVKHFLIYPRNLFELTEENQ